MTQALVFELPHTSLLSSQIFQRCLYVFFQLSKTQQFGNFDSNFLYLDQLFIVLI